MNFTSSRIPLRQTGAFSKIALDYIDQASALKTFFLFPPTLQGIQAAVEARKKFNTDRTLLVQELNDQYDGVETSKDVKRNISSLLYEDTFTITTAHQNNIFTGPLYFIYKILHVIKLAEHCKNSLPQYNFVPVFYMGSEDADLDELNNIHLDGEKLVWNTNQTGAVGRMKIDKDLLRIITLMEGQLSVMPFGKEIIKLIKECYKEGNSIQHATFRFVNALFAEYGLVVLIPDNAALKKQMRNVFLDDIVHQTASGIVEKSAEKLETAGYKVQANPREINLFYLKDDKRERIELQSEKYKVLHSDISFTKDELFAELEEHPERFSPNVILRGLYQETILPNIIFIGGGGETAYWLQLKELFTHYNIPFPILVLRNSFLIVEKKWQDRINKLGFVIEDFFLPEQELLNKLVLKESKNNVKLNGSISDMERLYEIFKKQAATVDTTLGKHVDALRFKTVQRLHELEKKMLRAEKRKFSDQQRQIQTIKAHLFPKNGLQERIDNICFYYAKWGREIIRQLYDNSMSLEQEFVVIKED